MTPATPRENYAPDNYELQLREGQAVLTDAQVRDVFQRLVNVWQAMGSADNVESIFTREPVHGFDWTLALGATGFPVRLSASAEGAYALFALVPKPEDEQDDEKNDDYPLLENELDDFVFEPPTMTPDQQLIYAAAVQIYCTKNNGKAKPDQFTKDSVDEATHLFHLCQKVKV